MLVIEIHPGAEVRAISYTNKQGAPAQLHKQTAWAHLTSKDGSPAPYPSQCEILVLAMLRASLRPTRLAATPWPIRAFSWTSIRAWLSRPVWFR